MAKKKQHVVTVEELRLMIKHDKASYWQHSAPLFGIVKTQGGLAFLPVDPIVEGKIILLFVLDPADFMAERAFELAELFRSRYKDLPWLTAFVFDQKYIFTGNPQFWDRFKKTPSFGHSPVYYDSNSEFSDWAKVEKFPKALFIKDGEVLQEFTLDGDAQKTFLTMEASFQEFLRKDDPGLPLPLLYEYELEAPVDVKKVVLEDIDLKGNWVTGASTAMTEDYNAVMIIPFEGTHLRMIASLHTTAREAASRITVTFNDKPIMLPFVGSDITTDSNGATTFEVSRVQGIYDLFHSSEVVKGVFQLHLKNAVNSPVIYWGLRFG